MPVVDALTDRPARPSVAPAGTRSLLLALIGTGTPDLSPVALVRATLAAADLPAATPRVVAVPLRRRTATRRPTTRSGQRVVAHLRRRRPGARALDRARASLPDERRRRIVERDQPGAGPSRAWCCSSPASPAAASPRSPGRCRTVILEQGDRTVTSLDGDVVRRNLSRRADLLQGGPRDQHPPHRLGGRRDRPARRRRGVLSPIAPFDETRQQVRAMVEDAGGAFVLVHVATPLEECERRDRKGLYAKARARRDPGVHRHLPPYEEPEDAAVRVDTTGRTIEDALDDVLTTCRRRLSRRPPSEPTRWSSSDDRRRPRIAPRATTEDPA